MEKSTIKIAIVHDFLTKIGGAEKVLASFHEIFPEAPIFTLLYDKEGTKGFFEAEEYRIISSSLNRKPKFIRKRVKFLLPFFPRAVEEFNFDQYDVVISFSSSFAHGILTKPKTLHICYCYSPMRYAWDWYHEYLSENKLDHGWRSLIARLILHRLRIWDFIAARRVDKWLTQSETARGRISKYYRIDSDVINPPTDLSKIEVAKDAPSDSYLIVSRLEPYKNIELAIRAFNKSGKKLIIIGEGSQKAHLESIANKNITFKSFLPEKEVYKYMRQSKALVFPGEEDFGLTPIESMAAGRPVIAYKKGGVTETVVENKTGLFFAENSEASLLEAIDKFDQDSKKFSPENCRSRAEKFSKTEFQSRIKNYIEQSLERHQNGQS